jgi:hypothetical protein
MSNEPVVTTLSSIYLLGSIIWIFFILATYTNTVLQLVVAEGLTNSRCLQVSEEIIVYSLGLLCRRKSSSIPLKQIGSLIADIPNNSAWTCERSLIETQSVLRPWKKPSVDLFTCRLF